MCRERAGIGRLPCVRPYRPGTPRISRPMRRIDGLVHAAPPEGPSMPDSNRIEHIHRFNAELTDIHRTIHAHPEFGLEEHRTAELVAKKLSGLGIEALAGVGGTGVVGVLRAGDGPQKIGLR